MFSRILRPPKGSFFLLGPRGTGKTAFVRAAFPKAVYLDLLRADLYAELLAAPQRLDALIPPRFAEPVVLDEIQKVPALLDEVHRLIESRRLRFVLTGSSARKLRARGTNLLAGRAVTRQLHPLTAGELAGDFALRRALRFGFLPTAWNEPDPADYLASYASTYLREEVQQEAITRNLAGFARFLEAASFSQGSLLNISAVARDCAVERKAVEGWFGVLEDLLLAVRIPVFARRAKRATIAHPKFYFFDVGVYRALRPKGPLDSAEEADGAALETLVLEQLRAVNDGLGLGYAIHYWRTPKGLEVDFVLYGERGLVAIEVKRGRGPRPEDLRSLAAFGADYPAAKRYLFHGGPRRTNEDGIEAWPLEDAVRRLPELLA